MNTDAGARANAQGWFATIEELLERFDAASEDDRASDDVRQEIEEGPLSVLVRDGWHSPGQQSEDGPEEYEILLSTGGPALRIWGKLGKYCEPETAELQMQDWFTPWTFVPCDVEKLLRYAQFFYFGE